MKFSFTNALRETYRNGYDIIHDLGMFTVGLGGSVSFMAIDGYGIETAQGTAIGGYTLSAIGFGLWSVAEYKNYYRNKDDRELARLDRQLEDIGQQIDLSSDPGYNDPQ